MFLQRRIREKNNAIEEERKVNGAKNEELKRKGFIEASYFSL